ncbi:MAG: hypothetical protein WKG32_04060 [Gemmatimonadaceae bacterium]
MNPSRLTIPAVRAAMEEAGAAGACAGGDPVAAVAAGEAAVVVAGVAGPGFRVEAQAATSDASVAREIGRSVRRSMGFALE